MNSTQTEEHVHDENCDHEHEHSHEDQHFNKGLELYNDKAPYEEVIAVFEEGLKNNLRDSSYHTCLSWLYILKNKGDDRKKALNHVKNALKYDPTNAQAQFNLVLIYLMSGKKGVREEFEQAISMSRSQDLQSAKSNLEEAIERNGEKPAITKLLKWIETA